MSQPNNPDPREHWKSGAENHERGVAWLNQIYQRNRGDSMNPMAAHKDFGVAPYFQRLCLSLMASDL